MDVITRSAPLTAHEALPLKHAALGAARMAAQSGDTPLSGQIMAHARIYNRVARRGVTGAPALTVPAVKDMRAVNPGDLPESFKAVMTECARMGHLSEWRIVGEANAAGEPFRPLVARQGDKAVRFMEIPAVPVKAVPEPVKATLKVQQTKIADLPEGTRELVKAAKDAGRLTGEWTEVKIIDWDGQKTRICARLFGKSVRYGIAA